MDKNSVKLAGLITKLTDAANKAVKKDEARKFQSRSSKKDFHVPLNFNPIEGRFNLPRITE